MLDSIVSQVCAHTRDSIYVYTFEIYSWHNQLENEAYVHRWKMWLRNRRIRALWRSRCYNRSSDVLLRIHRFRLRRHYRRGSERSAKIDPNSDRCLLDRRFSRVFRRCYGFNDRASLLRARCRNPVSSSVREYRLGLGEMAGNHRRHLRPMFQVNYYLTLNERAHFSRIMTSRSTDF